MPQAIIECSGWTAHLQPGTGTDYYIYDRTGNGKGERGFRGLARSEESALEWLRESSGWNYEQMPVVQESELTVKKGERQRLACGPGWYQVTLYYHGDKLLGRMQTKCHRVGKREQIDTHTSVGDYCVRGTDLRWLLKENGLRLG